MCECREGSFKPLRLCYHTVAILIIFCIQIANTIEETIASLDDDQKAPVLSVIVNLYDKVMPTTVLEGDNGGGEDSDNSNNDDDGDESDSGATTADDSNTDAAFSLSTATIRHPRSGGPAAFHADPIKLDFALDNFIDPVSLTNMTNRFYTLARKADFTIWHGRVTRQVRLASDQAVTIASHIFHEMLGRLGERRVQIANSQSIYRRRNMPGIGSSACLTRGT